MLSKIIKSVFGSRNDRLIRKYSARADEINRLEDSLIALPNADLKAKTAYLKSKIAEGAPLESLLIEAFAVCREASKRILEMRHFDVQLIGGMVLLDGKISEMRTGEGKTLVATLPAYLLSSRRHPVVRSEAFLDAHQTHSRQLRSFQSVPEHSLRCVNKLRLAQRCRAARWRQGVWRQSRIQ